MPPAAPRTPATLAVERLAKLAGQGAAVPKMLAALDDILIHWAAEELPPDDLRERVEAMQNDIDAGAQAAEDYVAEADTESTRAAAGRQLDALRAVQARLAAVISG